MARKRFTPEQIVSILREAERGAERKALFRKHGISEQTFYRWKRMYGDWGYRRSSGSSSWRKRTGSSRSWWASRR